MLRSIYLVARRDYLGYVTAWGFWLGLMITPVLFGIGLIAPSLAASSAPVRHFTVIDTNGAYIAAIENDMEERAIRIARDVVAGSELLTSDEGALDRFDTEVEAGADAQTALQAALPGMADQLRLPDDDFRMVDPPADTVEGLRPWLSGQRMVDTASGPVPLFAAIVYTPDGIEYWSDNVNFSGIQSLARRAARDLARSEVYAENNVPETLSAEIESRTLDVVDKKLVEGSTGGAEVTLADRAPFFVSIGLSFMLWMLIFSVVNYLLMGTIEERSNKIFDSLLTSVKLPHLLAGKLLAVLAVSFTLMSVWSIGGTAITFSVGSAMPPEVRSIMGSMVAAALDPAMLVPALISFLLGYLMYGAVFLALGSLCDTIQEAQTLMTPLLVLLMVPLFMAIVAIEDPESGILAIMSWIPLFTPFLLILRSSTEPPLWEVLGQLSLMAFATVVILWLAARVYRAGAVHGAGVNDALGWMKRIVTFGRAGNTPKPAE